MPLNNLVQAGLNKISESTQPNSINFSAMLNSSFH